MKYTKTAKQTQNEAITQSNLMELFPTMSDFAREVSKEVDSVFTAFMNERIGPGWKYELLEVKKITAKDSTMPHSRYELIYDGRPVGRIRYGVAVQNNKAIGNVFVEMEERKAV